MHYSLRGVTDMGMICGGDLALLLERITDTHAARVVFEAGREAEEACRLFVQFSRFLPAEGPASGTGQSAPGAPLALAEGASRLAGVERFTRLPETGAILPEGGPDLSARLAAVKGSEPRYLEHHGEQYLLEPFPRPFRVVFFLAGGHVPRETAALACNVGFRTIAADDRPEFAAAERFPGSATECLPSLGENDCVRFLDRLRPGPADGIGIVTRGHAHDRGALAALVRTRAGYIGMIGSTSKWAAVYGALRQSGIAEETLAAVHSSIGLAIGAETPAEIAVSIVAELVTWRKVTPASYA